MLLWVWSSLLVLLWLMWKTRKRIKCKKYQTFYHTCETVMEVDKEHTQDLQQAEAAGPSETEECPESQVDTIPSSQVQDVDLALPLVTPSPVTPKQKQLKFAPSQGSLAEPRNTQIKKPPLSRFILGSSEDNSSDDEFAGGSFKSSRKSSFSSIGSQTFLSSLPETETLTTTISNHHPKWIGNIPGRQFQRIKRNCTDNVTSSRTETEWIYRIGTLHPKGLNIDFDLGAFLKL